MSVLWLAIAAFAIGTESFVIAGLLPAIASDLQISASATGQLVTAYALTYAVGSPVLAVLFNNLDRKTVLVFSLSCFIAGNVLAISAGSYVTLIAARMLMAVGAGLCMPTALAVALAVAPPERQGRAISLVISGMTVATVVGAPIGAWVGHTFGWRATFIMVAALGAVALAGLVFGLPKGLPRHVASLAERIAIARHGQVLRFLVVTMLWAVGGFTVFTYLSVLMQQLGFQASDTSLALLVFGVAAAIGNTLGGILTDRAGPIRTAALGVGGIAAALILQSATLKFAPPDLASPLFLGLVFIWGVSGWTFYPGQVANLVRIEPKSAMIALSLNASAMYFGFALGSALGGVVLMVLTPTDLGWVGGGCAAAGLAVLLLSERRAGLKLHKIAG